MADQATILIVDDNPNNLQVLSALLSEAGYTVRPALSGELALRAVEARLPDLILLDVRMPPGIDGYETCRRLRANPNSRDVPVIFISALDETSDKLSGFDAGGVDFIAKPFEAQEVLARVRTHIQLHRMQHQLESMVRQRTEALTLSEARYRVLFEDSPIPILVFDCATLEILAVNSAFTRTLGYSKRQAVGRSAEFAVIPVQHERLRSLIRTLTDNVNEPAFTNRLQFRHLNGEVLEIEGVLQRIDYAEHPAQILMLQDVTESRRAAERLQELAKAHKKQLEKTEHYDALTGLPNRALFSQRMQQGLQQARLSDDWMVVCILDIDAFRPLNDSHGPEIGNRLLIELSERLRGCLHGGETVARMGGDEFALLLLRHPNEAELEKLLATVHTCIELPFAGADAAIRLSAGLGFSVYPQDDSDPDTLLRHAEQAMLLAKQSGKGQSRRFDPELDRRVREHQVMLNQIRSALERREFLLYYQPKVDLGNGRVVGAEALIRWQHPERGLLTPGAFLPAIEGHELLIDLGDWVINEALRQMADWRAQGVDLAVSVNIAAQHFMRTNFVNRLGELMAAHPGTPPQRLELEVLETSELDDIEQVEQLIVACRDMGIGFSLDDFGTGYSSLTYLRRLSADTLKIDQSFIRDMLSDPDDLALVAGIIGLAAAFKRKVIAEGVETVAHGKVLLELGCTMVQGYGIARPMPAQDLPEWLEQWPEAAWLKVINR